MARSSHRRLRKQPWIMVVVLALLSPARLPAQEAPAAADAVPEASTAERLRELEALNRKLLEKFDDLSKKNEDLTKQVEDLSKKVDSRKADDGAVLGKPNDDPGGEGKAEAPDGNPESFIQTNAGGAGRPESSQDIGNRRLGKLNLKAAYDYDRAGFLFETEDSEVQLKVRGLLQADTRIYEQSDQDPVSGGFYIPRMRVYFSGRLTKPWQYELSLQRGYNELNLLNAYLNYKMIDDRVQLRVGRYKTPFTYEFYRIGVQNLAQPERSLFNVNFQGNRQIGAMAWGELFGRRLEYAVGAFDGPRNSFQDFNNTPDVVAFLNAKPFDLRVGSPLRDLNFGGSVDYGDQDNPTRPRSLRTSQQTSTAPVGSNTPADVASVPFLEFHDNVRESGIRALWEMHLDYFYKSLSLLAAWDSGFSDYSRDGSVARRARIPIDGWHVQAAYLLTGETVTERSLIDPLHPFDLRPGHFGLGAIELAARYSALDLGDRVFTAGLADPNLWTDRVQMTDIGFNWYPNKFIKIYFDWEHASFADPVFYAPGPRLQKTSDLFWMRAQLYF